MFDPRRQRLRPGGRLDQTHPRPGSQKPAHLAQANGTTTDDNTEAALEFEKEGVRGHEQMILLVPMSDTEKFGFNKIAQQQTEEEGEFGHPRRGSGFEAEEEIGRFDVQIYPRRQNQNRGTAKIPGGEERFGQGRIRLEVAKSKEEVCLSGASAQLTGEKELAVTVTGKGSGQSRVSPETDRRK